MTRDQDGLHAFCDKCSHGADRLTRFDGLMLCPVCVRAARRGEREQRFHTDSARAIERGDRRTK